MATSTLYDLGDRSRTSGGGTIDPRFQTATASSPGRVWDYAQQPSGTWAPNGGGDMNAAGAASDPFAYTNGSLLTPWNRTFQAPTTAPSSSGGSGGGAPAQPAAPGFDFGFGGYSARDVGDFNLGAAFAAPGQPFSGGRLAAPADFSGSRLAEMPRFGAPVGTYSPESFTGAGAFAGGPQFSQDRMAGFDAFKAPDMSEDPGYQFRLKQGQDALMNSQAAKGLLRNSNTMRALVDYNSGAASQEYGAAYGRAKGEYDTAANLAMARYDRNAAANRDESTINFDQRATAYGLNSQNARDVYDRNTEAGYRTNETAYGRAASEYDRNQQADIARNEINYGRDASESDRNFQRGTAVNEANYGRAASEYDRTFSNARDVYQMNTGNQLAAYQANAQNAQAMGNLGWQTTSGTYDRNFQNYSTGFQVDEQRRQQAAAAAASGAASGRAQEALDYNRALTQYGMEYDQFNANQDRQFQRLYQMAALGQGAAGQVGNFAGQYGNAAGNYITGAGNAYAAGQVGAGNAWQSGMQGAGNAGLTSLGMYLGSQRQA